jgi:lipid II:glycine glycyltransferase (peptidoglycan interpeptide bridge formation enzyme)
MERELFKEKAKESIDAIFAKIDELEARKDQAIAHAKLEYEEKLTELKAKKAELVACYDKLTEATEDNWEEVKETFSSASESFREGFSKIASLFK